MRCFPLSPESRRSPCMDLHTSAQCLSNLCWFKEAFVSRQSWPIRGEKSLGFCCSARDCYAPLGPPHAYLLVMVVCVLVDTRRHICNRENCPTLRVHHQTLTTVSLVGIGFATACSWHLVSILFSSRFFLPCFLGIEEQLQFGCHHRQSRTVHLDFLPVDML